MADPLPILTDQQVQRFIVDGYVILQADGMPGLHDRIRSTIEEVYEPYLLQLGFLDRTTRGRVATQRAYEHLGIDYPQDIQVQPGLF